MLPPPKEAQALNPTGKLPAGGGAAGRHRRRAAAGARRRAAVAAEAEVPRPTNVPSRRRANHYRHFVDACLGGEKTESNFAQTGADDRSDPAGHGGDPLFRSEAELGPRRDEISRNPEAERYLRRDYRDGLAGRLMAGHKPDHSDGVTRWQSSHGGSSPGPL